MGSPMDTLRSSLGRHLQYYVSAANFRKYHCEAAGLKLGAWDKLVCEVIRAGHLGSLSNSEELTKALGLKGSAGVEFEDPPDVTPAGPLDRLARSRARKRGSIIFQYGKGRSAYAFPEIDSSYFNMAGYQWRSSSTLQKGNTASRTDPEVAFLGVDTKERASELSVRQLTDLRKDGKESGLYPRGALAKRKPPKVMGAAAVVWNIHSVLKSMPWGPPAEEDQRNLVLQLRNHHVSQVLRGLKDPNLAFEFFKWCRKQDGYNHDALNYNMMIGILATARAPKGVLQLLEDMSVVGLEVYPNTLITVILNFDRAEKLHEVVHVFNEAKRYNMQLNVGVYTCLIDVLARREEFQQAMKFYSAMQRANHALDNTAYNVLMRAFGRAKNVGKVCSLFQEMKEKGCNPDMYTFGFLIGALAKAGRMEEAFMHFRDMTKSGFTPDVPREKR